LSDASEHSDRLDLNEELFSRQPLDYDSGASWQSSRKEFSPRFIKTAEMLHFGYIAGGRDEIFAQPASAFQNGLDVFQYRTRLRLDVALSDSFASVVDGGLTGDK
jgi:hypothetical protein